MAYETLRTKPLFVLSAIVRMAVIHYIVYR